MPDCRAWFTGGNVGKLGKRQNSVSMRATALPDANGRVGLRNAEPAWMGTRNVRAALILERGSLSMYKRLAGISPWLCGSVLAVLMAGSGCQSTTWFPPPFAREATRPPAQQSSGHTKTSSAEPPTNSVVTTGMELQWSIQTPVEQPGLMRSGRSTVGPDGAMVIGPYGNCKVAGMTLEQASKQVEKQLSAYVKQPRVVLGSEPASTIADPPAPPPVQEIVWRKSALPAGSGVAQNQGTQPPAADGTIRPAEFQPVPRPKELPIPLPTLPEP